MATADLDPVSVESRRTWFEEHSPARHPLRVAEDDGKVRAWLSFQPFYSRPAYHATAEISIYVGPQWVPAGLGRKTLYARQVSRRGGELWCEDRGERVRIAGRAVLFLEGQIELEGQ